MKKLNSKGFLKGLLTKYVLIALFASIIGITAITVRDATKTEAADCDSNAIVYCGVTQSNLPSKYSGLDAKGKGAFAHAGVVPSQLGQTVVCQVTRDNKVFVGGQLVATNAYSYGRENMPGSTQISGGAYMRHPSVSFRSQSITSYCHMEGQEFKWAVISSCGNPVKATPTHRNNPRLSIVKTANKTEVIPGETFNYTVTVRNTGNVALRDVVIVDVLPDGLEPVGLNTGVTYNQSTRRITWPSVPRLPVDGSIQKIFKVKVSDNASGRKVNIACVKTDANPTLPICDDVTITINRPKVRIEKDVSVTAPVDVNQEFDYTINVTNIGTVKLTNLKITDTLPDGIIAVDNPTSRTVSFLILSLNPGESKTRTFRAKALNTAPIGTTLKNVACVDTDQTDKLVCDDADVEVKNPFFSCDALNIATVDADQTLPFSVNFSAEATAGNGAVIEGYIWNFGDGQTDQTTDSSVNHDYNQTGTFTATVQVKTNKGTTPVSDKCSVKVKVDEKVPVYSCDKLNVTKLGDKSYRFAVNYTAKDGATLKDFTYDFGDGNSDTTTNNPVDHTYAAAGTYNASVSVTFLVNGEEKTVTSNACKKTIKIEAPEEPVYTCDKLNVTKLGDKSYRFAVNYTAKDGATLKDFTYDFGDGNSDTTTNNPVDHTYAAAGTYNASVSVTFLVNGEEKTVTSNACKKTIKIEAPEEPVYTCDSLDVTHLGALKYKFVVNATASNGATVKSYSVAYGDGKSDSGANNTFEHTYAQPGKYNAQATVVFDVDGVEKTVSGQNCAAVIDTEKPQNCTVPGKEHLPADSPECKPDTPMCTVPGKEHLPADSPECVEDETPEVLTTTTTLPDTGIGDIFGLFVASTVAGAAARSVFASRRFLGL